jgi:hypothetical protein
MSTIPSSAESPAHVFAQLLLKLHALISAGGGDSLEADSVRDEMDGSWQALTEAERDRLGALSEDLYELSAQSLARVRLTPAERSQWAQEARQAVETGHWDRLLELLRRPPEDLPPDRIRQAQARSWESLGEREIALRFEQEAHRLHRPGSHGVPTDSWITILNGPV